MDEWYRFIQDPRSYGEGGGWIDFIRTIHHSHYDFDALTSTETHNHTDNEQPNVQLISVCRISLRVYFVRKAIRCVWLMAGGQFRRIRSQYPHSFLSDLTMSELLKKCCFEENGVKLVWIIVFKIRIWLTITPTTLSISYWILSQIHPKNIHQYFYFIFTQLHFPLIGKRVLIQIENENDIKENWI